MGRGKRRDAGSREGALSDSERERRYLPIETAEPLSEAELLELEAPARTRYGLAALRAGLEERIERELSFSGSESLGEALCDDYANPLQHFIDFVVYDECRTHGADVHLVVQDADDESLECSATILADYAGAQSHPVPAMIVYADLSHYAGAQGARALAEEFYAAIAQVAATEPQQAAAN